jgi:hypothetical protein
MTLLTDGVVTLRHFVPEDASLLCAPTTAAESLRAPSRSLAFTELGFDCLELLADADNIASLAVARHAGFREVGLRDGQLLHTRRRPGTSGGDSGRQPAWRRGPRK